MQEAPTHLPNPHLSESPEDTRSYVVTAFDPDGPSGSGFWHWTLIDGPGSVTSPARLAGTEESLPGPSVRAAAAASTAGM
jgi:phosphatidylethanolamine-binding protein (PEBP) family uncharacterized protein